MLSFADFTYIVTGLFTRWSSFPHAVVVVLLLFRIAPLLKMHRLQYRTEGGRRETAWLTAARAMLRAGLQQREGLYDPHDADDAPNGEKQERFLNRLLDILDWFRLWELPDLLSPEKLTILDLLITEYTHCIICPGEGHQRRVLHRYKRFRPVTLITSAYRKTTAMLVVAYCSGCRARYFPDCIVFGEGRMLWQSYVYNPYCKRL